MPAFENIPSIKERLIAERARLVDSFKGLTPDIMTRPFEGGWSIKDVLAHLAMAEGVNVKFAKMMTVKDTPVQLDEFASEYPDFPPPFELDKFNAWMTERWRKRALIEVIGALHATRAETLAWLDTLTPAQIEKTGVHAAWGNQTVRGIFRILVIHDKFHRGDIEKRRT